MSPEMAGGRRVLSGWGSTAPSAAEVVEPLDSMSAARTIVDAPRRGVIARGLGRSYGDAAQNAGGHVVSTLRLDAIELDATTGIAKVDAGVSLDALLRHSIPHGWFVPVSPGTRFVTVGGAIAADVHGGNHHVDGSFANHLDSFTLVDAAVGGDGARSRTHHVSPDSDAELFWATAGGMGLTGIVTEATMRLIPIETSRMLVDTDRYADLDALMAAMVEGDDRYRYSKAWVDCLATGASLGRSVLTRAEHAPLDALDPAQRGDPLAFDPKTRLSAPPWAPSWLLNRWSIRAFNELWFRKAPKHQVEHVEPLTSFFHPLDMVDGFNRLYGRRGFLEYQFVVGDEHGDVVRTALERASAEQYPSFLSVLKRFGPGNPGPLSFPMSGWTLVLDIPAAMDGLDDLLDGFDELVADVGGRVYLAKDSRLRPDLFPKMYPDLDRFAAVRDRVDPERVLQSDLARRLVIP